MAPLTRSASKRGPVQALPKSESQVIWFGDENSDQDLLIRLVSNKGNDDHTLALFMVHSSLLEKCSTYFQARLDPERWGKKRKASPHEITVHVMGDHGMGDVEFYTDYFSRMYNPLDVGFKSVSYSLYLLAVATFLRYDDLMSSICLYLASICPWTYYEEMRIRKAVSSDAFPRGHAKDLLERLEGCLTRDDIRSLVLSCMNFLQLRLNVIHDRHLPREGMDFLTYLVKTAEKQEWGPVPTFEQEAATIFIEEFKLLLVEFNDEAEKNEVAGNGTAHMVRSDSREGDQGMFGKVEIVTQALMIMLYTRTAEGVKAFVKCPRFAQLLVHEMLGSRSPDVMALMNSFAYTVMEILMEVLDGKLVLGDSNRDEFFINWLPSLDRLYRTATDKTAAVIRLRYPAVRMFLLSNRPCSKVLERIVFDVVAG